MKIVRESISFERGKDPKDAMRVGRKYGDELEIDGVYTVIGGNRDLEDYDPNYHHKLDGYDERKFFQNCEAGFFPGNLGVKIKDGDWIIPSDRLKGLKVKQLVYNDEITELG